MKHKYYLQKNFFFILGLSIIGIYLLFLFISVTKVLPGFIMQLIFLGEEVANSSPNCISLLTSFNFLLNISAGVILFILLTYAFLGIKKTLRLILNSRKIIALLKIIKKTGTYHVFRSEDARVFTAGLFHPQIYLSQKLFEILTPYELQAVILHEQVHQRNFDPLKDIVIQTLFFITPPFPYKKELLSKYRIIAEVACDEIVKNKLRSQKPIVMAIVELMKAGALNPFPIAAANFTLQNERLQVLVGKAKLKNIKLLGVSTVALVFLSISSFYLSKSQLFFECDHLFKCIAIFMNELSHNRMNDKKVLFFHYADSAERCVSDAVSLEQPKE